MYDIIIIIILLNMKQITLFLHQPNPLHFSPLNLLKQTYKFSK